MHDKAFEMGLFTVNKNFTIVVNKGRKMITQSDWYEVNLLAYDGCRISCGAVLPSIEALHYHWDRIGISIES